MTEQERIEFALNHIKEQIGVELKLCEHFTGLLINKKGVYFNVILDEKPYFSQDYSKLCRLTLKSQIITGVALNGIYRVSIFINF